MFDDWLFLVHIGCAFLILSLWPEVVFACLYGVGDAR